MQRVVGVEPHREFRGIGAPDNNGAGLSEIRRYWRIIGGYQVFQSGQAIGGGLAFDVDIGLDRDRHAVQRSRGFTSC